MTINKAAYVVICTVNSTVSIVSHVASKVLMMKMGCEDKYELIDGHGKTVIFSSKTKLIYLYCRGIGSESFAVFLNGVILRKTTRQ